MGLTANEEQLDAFERFLERYGSQLDADQAILFIQFVQTGAMMQTALRKLREIGENFNGK